MPYCLSCGRLHSDRGSYCKACAADFNVSRQVDKKIERQQILRNIANSKAESNGK